MIERWTFQDVACSECCEQQVSCFLIVTATLTESKRLRSDLEQVCVGLSDE